MIEAASSVPLLLVFTTTGASFTGATLMVVPALTVAVPSLTE